ncbi:MAG: RtcB family protein [Planctomycetota bacterium]
MKRIDKFRIEIEKTGPMRVGAIIYTSEKLQLEETAIAQLRDAATLPGVVKVLATPDIHEGYGVPIGCVMACDKSIVPAAVGYDINCGMRIVTTPLRAREVDVSQLAHSIRRDIPLGEGMHNIRFDRGDFEEILNRGVSALKEIDTSRIPVLQFRDEEEERRDALRIEEGGSMAGDVAALSERAIKRGISQEATLGGGNHFIEIQEVQSVYDEKTAKRFGLERGQMVIMIHSGSRGLGHQVGDDYIHLASRMTATTSPNRYLCYLPVDSEEGRNYIKAMHAAANFAFVNRQLMTVLVRKNVRHYHGDIPMPVVYDVPHNMAKFEEHFGRKVWVHRKGATRAFPKSRMSGTPFSGIGQPVLIPGSMGTASYVLLGTEESRESMHSVNHGAGRLMSRTKAAGRFRKGKMITPPAISDEEFSRDMKGITLICANKRSIREEAPGAYKDIDEVVRCVEGAGLATIVARMVPLAVLKG